MATSAEREVRWTSDEFRGVTRAVVPLLRQGEPLADAIFLAQSCLPKERQQSPQKIRTSSVIPLKVKKRLVELRLMTKTEVQTITDRKAGKIIWTALEWALVARRVKHFRDTMKDRRTVNRQIIAAAEVELPPERHRTVLSLSGCKVSENERQMIEALKKSGFLKGHPFDPTRTAYVPPESRKVTEFIDDTKHPDGLMQAPSAPQEAAKPQAPAQPPATQPQSASVEGLSFTVTAGPAVVELMRTMISQAVAAELDARFPVAMVKVTNHLQAGIASMLTHFLDAKPGDIVNPPAPPSEPEAPAPAAKVVHAVSLPLLDVVGLIGPQINQVRDTLNGHAHSVRFIDADHVDSWKPRGVVILNTKFIGHNAEFKCKKAGVKPIRVHGGADAVLRALHDLYVSQTVSVPANAPH